MAKSVKSADHRASLLQMADSWEQLAQQHVSKQIPVPHVSIAGEGEQAVALHDDTGPLLQESIRTQSPVADGTEPDVTC